MLNKGSKIILSSKQALLFYGIESKKSFEIDGNVANVGDMLKHAREYRNVSVELLAAKLNLEPKIIRKIEGNRFAALSGEIFVRGYIGLLARELNADLEPLMQVYELQRGPKENDEKEIDLNPTTSSQKKIGFVILVIISALSIYYLSYIIQSDFKVNSTNFEPVDIDKSKNPQDYLNMYSEWD